jgi:hypothetical protein
MLEQTKENNENIKPKKDLPKHEEEEKGEDGKKVKERSKSKEKRSSYRRRSRDRRRSNDRNRHYRRSRSRERNYRKRNRSRDKKRGNCINCVEEKPNVVEAKKEEKKIKGRGVSYLNRPNRLLLVEACNGRGWLDEDIEQNSEHLKFKPRFQGRNPERGDGRKLRSIAVKDVPDAGDKVSLLVLSALMYFFYFSIRFT